MVGRLLIRSYALAAVVVRRSCGDDTPLRRLYGHGRRVGDHDLDALGMISVAAGIQNARDKSKLLRS